APAPLAARAQLRWPMLASTPSQEAWRLWKSWYSSIPPGCPDGDPLAVDQTQMGLGETAPLRCSCAYSNTPALEVKPRHTLPAMLPVHVHRRGKGSYGSTRECIKFPLSGLFSWNSCIPVTGRAILLRVKCEFAGYTRTCVCAASKCLTGLGL